MKRVRPTLWLAALLASAAPIRADEKAPETQPASPAAPIIQPAAAAETNDAPPGAQAAAVTPAPSPRPRETPDEAADRPLTYGGSADLSSIANLNRPFDGLNGGRAFDIHDEASPHLGLLDLWVQHARQPVGGRIELGFGPTARLINAAEPSHSPLWEHLQQLYVGANLDRKGATYVDFGKWTTLAGAESLVPKENAIYSGGLLFTWSQPSYHFGIRAYHYFNANDYVAVLVHRGWNAVGDPHHGPGFGISGSRALNAHWTVTASYLGGKEGDLSGNLGYRSLIDGVLLYSPNDRCSGSLNFDYGTQSGFRLDTSDTPRRAGWAGISAVGKYGLGAGTSLAARVEWLNDGDGALLGDAMSLYSLTLNYTRTFHERFQTRLEYRYDFASGGTPFAGREAGRFTANQSTLTLSTIVSY